jgi:hypothetical protein
VHIVFLSVYKCIVWVIVGIECNLKLPSIVNIMWVEVMKFNSREIKEVAPRAKAPKNREERRAGTFRKFGRAVAGVVVSAFLFATPLVSNSAMADDGPKKGKGSGEAIEIVPLLSDEKAEAALRAAAKDPNYSAEKRAEAKKAADALAAKKKIGEQVDAKVEGYKSMSGEATEDGPGVTDSITETDEYIDDLEEFSEEIEAIERGEEPAAEEGKPLEAAEDGESAVSHNFIFNPDLAEMIKYLDTNLAPVPGMVGVRGESKKSALDQPIDVGSRIVGNEAGHAFFGAFSYLNLIRLDAGAAMFVGGAAVPIGRVMLSPELNIPYLRGEPGQGNVKMAYYGSAAFAGNMPSWVYSSHSAALGWSQSAGKNFTLRIGGIVGGAFSHPAYDDIFANLSTGLSMEFGKTVLIYAIPTCYFAADNPMRTAYIGYYEPKFQDVEVGIQAVMPDGFVGRLFADIGLVGGDYGIFNRYGGKLTKVVSTEKVELDIWGTIGMTQWTNLLGGGFDPMVMGGITASYGADGYRSTNSYTLSHLRDFKVVDVEKNIPDAEHPGPYGFGSSGDPYFDVPINEAKQRITESGSFEQFAGSYAGASTEDKITTARFLGAFMAQVAYANDAYKSMTTFNITDPDIQRIADASLEDMFNYVQAYINWYQNHGVGEQLPESLKDGIAVCAGIHYLTADFLNRNGVPAAAATVNTPNGPHVITLARAGGMNVLLDYGDELRTSGRLSNMYGAYGRHVGTPTFKSQIYVPGKGYIGTYNTSAEGLLRGAMGIDNKEILMRNYLGIW